jgi:nanoRNase/pAp phosphatase (c-di-AMP/oligoRNAs hydrolase)
MSIFDFIFPEQAQASHLRDIADSSSKIANSMRNKEANESNSVVKITVLQRRIGKLEDDVAMLSMINTLLIKKYIKDTGYSVEKLRAELAEIDKLDGGQGGGFDTGSMRKMLGIPLHDGNATPAMKERCKDCGRKVLTQSGICLYCGGVVH